MGNLQRVYERLARASERGTGMRLSANDVETLVTGDDAIEAVVMDIVGGWEAEKLEKAEKEKA